MERIKQGYCNFHTHSVLCDGNDTLEEMVIKAISLGCPVLGFSGHGIMLYDTSYCMSEEGTREYFAEIDRLRREYGDQIKILRGVEQDYYSEFDDLGAYDYVIGSVHAIYKDGEYLSVDMSEESMVESVTKHYDGDYYAFAEDYYKCVGDIYRKTKCDIIGHFDLVTKFNEGDRYFDTSDERYVKAYMSALDAIDLSVREAGKDTGAGWNMEKPAGGSGVVFEINTGAMARGYRTEAYPSKPIIAEILRRGYNLILNSDCHNREYLLCAYDEYQKYF